MLIPEDCSLIAYFDGECWCLSVEDTYGEEVAMLAWPGMFSGRMTADELRKCGFLIR